MTSTVLLYNAGTVIANAVLHIYDPNGKEVYTSSTITIPPNGAQTIAMPSSLPSAFIGSAQVTSDSPVRALVLDASASNTARDIYEGSTAPASYLTFPVFRHLGSTAQRSIIAAHNPDPSNSTTITFRYYDSNGTEASGSPISENLPPLASAYFDSMLMFNTSAFTYTVRIDSTGSLTGAEQVLFTKDTASVRGLTAVDEGTPLYLDWIERKGSSNTALTNWSEIYVQNRGARRRM